MMIAVFGGLAIIKKIILIQSLFRCILFKKKSIISYVKLHNYFLAEVAAAGFVDFCCARNTLATIFSSSIRNARTIRDRTHCAHLVPP